MEARVSKLEEVIANLPTKGDFAGLRADVADMRADIQKSVGEINATMKTMVASIAAMGTKVDDLVGWKHKILGGVAALGIVCTLIGFVAGKVSDYVSIKVPVQERSTPAQPSAPNPASPAAK